MFYHILERKKAFFGYNDKNFKKLKNWHFSKGVNSWFWSKNDHFSIVFLGNIGQESVFYHILERKKACFGYNDKNFQKLKNWQFSKNAFFGYNDKKFKNS